MNLKKYNTKNEQKIWTDNSLNQLSSSHNEKMLNLTHI